MMFIVKVKKHDVTVSSDYVALMAERLWRWPVERRQNAAEAAKKRLHGNQPRRRDAAIVVAMRAE